MTRNKSFNSHYPAGKWPPKNDQPHLAEFKDWFICNQTTNEAYGLLDYTISQANCWAVAHLDLSLNWSIVWAEDVKKIMEIEGESG